MVSPFLSTLSTHTRASIGTKIVFFGGEEDHQRAQALTARSGVEEGGVSSLKPLHKLSTQPS